MFAVFAVHAFYSFCQKIRIHSLQRTVYNVISFTPLLSILQNSSFYVYIKLTPYGKCTQHWKLMVFSFIGFENLHPSLVLLVRFVQSSEQAKL